MILFELRCGRDHRFEAWFRNGAAYDEQAAAGLISCPICGDSTVEKAPMAPSVLKGARPDSSAQTSAPPAVPAPVSASAVPAAPAAAGADLPFDPAQVRAVLKALHAHVQENCDYVGKDFPEEARKIHYGESEERPIYGEADAKEAQELKEEGISFAILPILPPEN